MVFWKNLRASGVFGFLPSRPDDVESCLRDAMAKQSFELHFQPLINIKTEKISGFEALLRLPGKDGKFISPAVFIPVAEATGMMNDIGRWVLNKACSVAAKWPDPLRISVNVSPIQFEPGDLPEVVSQALEKSGLPASRLEIEITESVILNHSRKTVAIIERLKEIGVSIALDDFGAGHSGLSYLWKFPFDVLKIDRSFIKEMSASSENIKAVVNGVIALGHSLNMKVTVEGIETLEQAQFLKASSCDIAQGYYFGRPTPERELARSFPDTFAPISAEASLSGALSTEAIS
jgi:EAL domain-containing protein (putative c-di-GMP-specific phosphodiesterase class I)